MRFDIEIQQDLIRLAYVEAGNAIDTSLIPALYMHSSDVNLVPKDFVIIDSSTRVNEATESPIFVSQFTDNKFTVTSDRILLTHIALYSRISNTKFPVFYNHIIDLKKYILDGNQFNFKSVIISTVDGTILDQSLYTIEYDSDYARVYVNPIDNSILQIQWSDSNKIFKEMLKLEPVYKDMGSNFSTASLGKYDFCCNLNSDKNTFTVSLGRENGTIYYKLKSGADIINPPICNMDDEWNLLFENILFYSTDKDEIECSYRLPEYYLQKQYDSITNQNFNGLFKKYENQTAKILGNYFVQTQLPPAITQILNVDIEIFDKNTNDLIASYTTTESKVNTLNDGSANILWLKISDYNYDGIFYIDDKLDAESMYAKATYYIDNKFYEFRYVDLKNTALDASRMLAVYIAPTYNYNDPDTFKMYYVFIGSNYFVEDMNKQKVMGACFTTKEEYTEFIEENSNMHLCYVSINTSKLIDIMQLSECSSTNISDPLLSTEEAISFSTALLSKHVIENEMRLPLNDTVYVNVENSLFKDKTNIPDNDEKEFLLYLKNVVNENITISTNVLVGKNMINSFNFPTTINQEQYPLSTTTTQFIGTLTPADPVVRITTTTTTTSTTTTTINNNSQIPFTWFDATLEDMWVPCIEYYGLPDGDPQKFGASWNGNGWNAWISGEDYSEVWMDIKENNWLQYRPLKMRITYSVLDEDEISVSYYTYQHNSYTFGEDGNNEPYTYTIMQEINIDGASDFSSIDIFAYKDAAFTVDKIEFYLSDESYSLPEIYNFKMYSGEYCPSWYINEISRGEIALPMSFNLILKDIYTLDAINVVDENNVRHLVDADIDEAYYGAGNYARYVVTINSIPIDTSDMDLVVLEPVYSER